MCDCLVLNKWSFISGLAGGRERRRLSRQSPSAKASFWEWISPQAPFGWAGTGYYAHCGMEVTNLVMTRHEAGYLRLAGLIVFSAWGFVRLGNRGGMLSKLQI